MKRRRESEDFPSDTPTSAGEVNQPSVSPPETTSSPHSPKAASPDSLTTPANDDLSTTTTNEAKMSHQPASKIVELDNDNNPGTVAMKCFLPPHPPLEFSTYGEYESHYYSTHANRCNECGKNFPSDHLLGLHIEEIHDSFVAVKRERGDKTFSCFVEGCDRKCSTAAKRNMHMIDKHMFPRNYFFDVTSRGIDGRRSMLQHERRHHHQKSSSSTASTASTATSTATDGPTANDVTEKIETPPVEESTAQDDPIEMDTTAVETADQNEIPKEQKPVDQVMEDLSGAMSALQFIPPSVRFGRGGRKGFTKK